MNIFGCPALIAQKAGPAVVRGSFGLGGFEKRLECFRPVGLFRGSFYRRNLTSAGTLEKMKEPVGTTDVAELADAHDSGSSGA